MAEIQNEMLQLGVYALVVRGQGDDLLMGTNVQNYIKVDGLEKLLHYFIADLDQVFTHIYDGDMVVVKPTRNALDNEIIVANVGDETTIKRLRRIGKDLVLKPENDTYPIIREAFEVIGKVIGVIRKL